MPRPRSTLPSYQKHPSGRARIAWTDPDGTRREKLLPGLFNSEESRQAFARLQLELATAPATPPSLMKVVDRGPSVGELLLSYLKFAEGYNGKKTAEIEAVRLIAKTLRELYGTTPAVEFGPLALKAVRESFVRRGWCRQYTNRMVLKVIRAFRWLASEELVPATVPTALKTVAPLKRGKTDAPEAKPRTPANADHVTAAIPHLTPHVRPIVELLRLTGARPSEICRMTLADIDRTPPVWVHSPKDHKTANRGRHRDIHLGPQAQEVIAKHLEGRTIAKDEPLFSPQRQREERFERMRLARRSKVQPSQKDRKKAKPAKVPGSWFTPMTVTHAIKDACRKAQVPEWTAYQLRHLRAAELRTDFRIEAARAVLGHAAVGMTSHYARGADGKLATEVASKSG